MNELNITKEWDKVFLLSEEVNHKKVTFQNHFGLIEKFLRNYLK